MNSTFFMVILIVVIFLLLLLFFQTSCQDKERFNNTEEIKKIMEGGVNDGTGSSGNIVKIGRDNYPAQFGLFRFETDNLGDNQFLMDKGPLPPGLKLTKGDTTKTRKYIKFMGYFYCKEPNDYRFFIEAYGATLKISNTPISIDDAKKLFKLNEKSELESNHDLYELTKDNNNKNLQNSDILINYSGHSSGYSNWNEERTSIFPKASKIKTLKKGIYKIEIISSSDRPIHFYWAKNKGVSKELMNGNIHHLTYRTDPKRAWRCSGGWLRASCGWRTLSPDHFWKYTFGRFNSNKDKLHSIQYSTDTDLVFFNYGNFISKKMGKTKRSSVISKFANTSEKIIGHNMIQIPANAIQKNATFNNEFLIEFDIKVNRAHSDWRSIFRITDSNNNCCGMNDRLVAMWLYPNSTKMHLVTASDKDGNHHENRTGLHYTFPINMIVRVSIYTEFKNGSRYMTFIAKRYKDSGDLEDIFEKSGINISRNDVNHNKQNVRIQISNGSPADASMGNFTYSINDGATQQNYVKRISELSLETIDNIDKLRVSSNMTPASYIFQEETLFKNNIIQLTLQDMKGTGDIFTVSKKNKDNIGQSDTVSDKPIIFKLRRKTNINYQLIWYGISKERTISFSVDEMNTIKLLILIEGKDIIIFQEINSSYKEQTRGIIEHGGLIDMEEEDEGEAVVIANPIYNGSKNIVEYTFHNFSIHEYDSTDETDEFKYLHPGFKCEKLTEEGKDMCGKEGTISKRLNDECVWFKKNDHNGRMTSLGLNPEISPESEYSRFIADVMGTEKEKCINNKDLNQCFMREHTNCTQGSGGDMCIIHPHKSGKPICLNMEDKPVVNLQEPNQFEVNIKPSYPISTIAQIESADNDKIKDLNEVINNQNQKLNNLSKEIDRIETIETFANNNQAPVEKIQSINQATTIYASPMENNETSFKLHVNDKCVTVYDKEKLLLTDCNPELLGHGFKKFKVSNNIAAKVETGKEPIHNNTEYPYPYDVIKSDLTSQCLNIDLKNNLSLQECNPDKVDQFFRSHYTQKS